MNNSDQPTAENTQITKKFILVAEDDPFYAKIYKLMLTKEGYEVQITEDGVEAMKIARQRKPDLILLDLVMPHKDGFETLEELKTYPKLRSVKVVVLTNLGQQEDKDRIKRLGAQDYIVKSSLSIDQMMERIKSFL